MQRSRPVRRRGSGACPDTRRSNRPCETTISTHSVFPDSMSPPKLNPVDVARRSGWEDSDNQDGNPASRHWHDRRGVSVAQGTIEGLIAAARRSGVGRDCRVDWRPAAASLAFERGAAAIAFHVHLKDGGMMNEAVDDSDRHCLVRKDLAPFAKRLVGSDEEGSPLVAGADQFKEHAGFGL